MLHHRSSVIEQPRAMIKKVKYTAGHIVAINQGAPQKAPPLSHRNSVNWRNSFIVPQQDITIFGPKPYIKVRIAMMKLMQSQY